MSFAKLDAASFAAQLAGLHIRQTRIDSNRTVYVAFGSGNIAELQQSIIHKATGRKFPLQSFAHSSGQIQAIHFKVHMPKLHVRLFK